MRNHKTVLVVGAGFTGAVIARSLAEGGHDAVVIDERDHVAGNCHTARDSETGIMLHVYGPHIFHTDDETVWQFINRHCEMMPYRHQVKARVGDRVFTMPINLHTINQFFGKAMSPAEARAFIESLAEGGAEEPQSFAAQGLRFVGRDIYEAFFHGYTLKQWGVSPDRLPAAILKRLPLRFTYDDNYFFHRYQGIPRDGYTAAVASILAHPKITLRLSTSFEKVVQGDYDHVVYTGPLDRYFDHALGRLSYRTLRFEREVTDAPCQGTAVMNYCDAAVPHTRITEHMYFAPWEAAQFSQSIIYREYSASAGPDDIPYYPVRLLDDKTLLDRYVSRADQTPGVTFAGRLGDPAGIRRGQSSETIICGRHPPQGLFAQGLTSMHNGFSIQKLPLSQARCPAFTGAFAMAVLLPKPPLLKATHRMHIRPTLSRKAKKNKQKQHPAPGEFRVRSKVLQEWRQDTK